MNKLTELRNLVSKRREPISGTLETNYSRNYLKLGDFHNGGYDFDDHVVPYSKSAFNLNAKIMIILQDWASENFLNRPINEVQKQLGHDPVLPTNKNLFRLLDKFFDLEFSEVYATDVFPFVKSGDMGTKIPMADMVLAANQFAIPQIKIISPKLVICLGRQTFNSIRKASGLKEISLSEPLEKNNFSIGNSIVIGAHHVGGMGTSMLGGKLAQEQQWEQIVSFFERL